MTERPWTKDVSITSQCPCGCGHCSLSNQTTFGHTFTEADARLFAAAPQMYEALEAARDAINDLMPTLGEENRRELNDSELSALDAMLHIHAALRAANPDVFESEVE